MKQQFSALQREAIEVADANLNNVSLPTYSELLLQRDEALQLRGMSQADTLAFARNVDLARMRGDQAGKMLAEARRAANLGQLQIDLDGIANTFWAAECSVEEIYRKKMAELERGAA